MYYRRKVLLSLLELFDNELEKLRLQKLLLLFCKFQEKPAFDFVPYKFGCFSFRANADLNTMSKYKQVKNTEKLWQKIDSTSYLSQLKEKDKKALVNLKRFYGKKTSSELIKITYQKFPFYAINSTILEDVLTKSEIVKVRESIPNAANKSLFTIGYEGISLEAYLNKLITHNVNALIDVRKNPVSMKYGFSKKQLGNACSGIGIKYFHFPALGIDSDKRKQLVNQSDYDELFKEYKEHNLLHSIDTQKEVFDILKNLDRIALTCFEADVCQCHRKPLSESISQLPGFGYDIKHI